MANSKRSKYQLLFLLLVASQLLIHDLVEALQDGGLPQLETADQSTKEQQQQTNFQQYPEQHSHRIVKRKSKGGGRGFGFGRKSSKPKPSKPSRDPYPKQPPPAGYPRQPAHNPAYPSGGASAPGAPPAYPGTNSRPGYPAGPPPPYSPPGSHPSYPAHGAPPAYPGGGHYGQPPAYGSAGGYPGCKCDPLESLILELFTSSFSFYFVFRR